MGLGIQGKFAGGAGFLGVEAFAGGLEVVGVQFDAGEGGEFQPPGGEGGSADAEEGVEQPGLRALAVEADALLDEGDGKGGGVGALLVAGLDGLTIRNRAFDCPRGVFQRFDCIFLEIHRH